MLEAAFPRVRELIEEARARYRIPGVAAGIVLDGKRVWSEGFGAADLDSGRPVDERSLFRVASITKTFTGAAIMVLRDEGRLSLDDPLVKHVPEFKQARARRGTLQHVTLRRLLTHHSGLISEAPFDYWHTLEFPPFEAILARLPEVEVVLEPDRRWKYSNLAFALLGEVVARVSGTPYERYVEAKLFRPLGLASSAFSLSGELSGRFATGYDPDPYSDRPAAAVHSDIAGLLSAGGLYSCVEDLANWAAFQMTSSLRGLPEPADFARTPDAVLSPDTLAEMQRPQILEADWKSGYGMPWRTTRSGDRVYVNHGGALPGHRSALFFDPVRKIGFVFLSNLGWHNGPEDVSAPAMDALADEFDRGRTAKPSFDPVPPHLARFLGSYASRDVLFTDVGWRGGSLRLELPPGVRSLHAPATLEPTDDPLRFLVVGGRGAGELARFSERDGGIASLSLGGAVYLRLEARTA